MALTKKKEKSITAKKTQKEEVAINQNDWLELEGELVIDVYQTNNEFIVQAPVAGVKPEDIEIAIENDVLKVKGKREKTKKIKEGDYLLKECFWGAFSKEIILPEKINKSRVEASIKEGILTIKLPKKKEKKGKKIVIKTD